MRTGRDNKDDRETRVVWLDDLTVEVLEAAYGGSLDAAVGTLLDAAEQGYIEWEGLPPAPPRQACRQRKVHIDNGWYIAATRDKLTSPHRSLARLLYNAACTLPDVPVTHGTDAPPAPLEGRGGTDR